MFMFTLYLYFLCIMSWGGRVSHLLCSPQSRCQHYLYLCERCPLPAPKRKSLTKVSPNLQYISTWTLSKYVSKENADSHDSQKCFNCLYYKLGGKVPNNLPTYPKHFHFVILKKKWIFAANCVTSTEEEWQYCSAQHQHRYILQFCQFPFPALLWPAQSGQSLRIIRNAQSPGQSISGFGNSLSPLQLRILNS